MIIKKFLANTEKDAIKMAKQELGSNAVVMNIKKVRPRGLAKLFVRSKVEVTAALEEDVSYSDGLFQPSPIPGYRFPDSKRKRIH